jgi:hypothetical protein
MVVADSATIPAAAFERGPANQPPLAGLTATPYRRDQLDDLIALQLGLSVTQRA